MILIIVIIILGVLIFNFVTPNQNEESINEVISNVKTIPESINYQYSGILEDVTGGNSTGLGQAEFENSEYNLLVTTTNLPDLQGTNFYEGWVVRKGIIKLELI